MGMFAYFMRHWRGDQNIAQSLLVNGVLPYFVLGAAFIVANATFNIYLLMWWFLLFIAWLVWGVVGTTRSALRTLRSGAGITSQILAVVALALVVVVLVDTARQVVAVVRIYTLYRLNPGRGAQNGQHRLALGLTIAGRFWPTAKCLRLRADHEMDALGLSLTRPLYLRELTDLMRRGSLSE
jgi:hypothetical protein